jgi:hypothetical protein
MAWTVIKTARELHSVRTPQQYREKHARAIATRAARGERVAVLETIAPLEARIDPQSGWIVDCDCGAGNATDPAWGFACCFGCGAVHVCLGFPVVWKAIEALLLRRPRQENRGWRPGETLEDLRADNLAHGLEG